MQLDAFLILSLHHALRPCGRASSGAGSLCPVGACPKAVQATVGLCVDTWSVTPQLLVTVGRAVVITVRWGQDLHPAVFLCQADSTAATHILYVDGSGSVQSPGEQYFILGGVSIFERQIYHLIRHLDDYVGSLELGPPEDIELHASVIANGKGRPWKGIPRKRRLEIIDGALDVFMNKGSDRTRLFAAAVDKQFRVPQDPVEYAFEEIRNRFNLQLARICNRSPKADAQ